MNDPRAVPTLFTKRAESIGSLWLGVDVRTHGLYGEFDLNYRIETADGRRFVLKIMRDASEQTWELVELQLAVLHHLSRRGLAVECPRPIPTPAGELSRLVEGPGGEPRVAWLLSYIDGGLLADVPCYDDELLDGLGSAVAELDRALLDFEDPRAERSLMWDVARAMESRELAGCVQDAGRRAIVERRFDDFENNVLPRLLPRPRTIIHNDGGNQHNMIVRETARGAVTLAGIIDFGDAALTHTVCGLGIAAAYATFGRDDPADAMARVAVGYHRILPLDDDDLWLVDRLAATRLTVSVCIAAQRIARDPSDEYAAVSAAPAWRSLERLQRSDPARSASRIREFVLATG